MIHVADCGNNNYVHVIALCQSQQKYTNLRNGSAPCFIPSPKVCYMHNMVTLWIVDCYRNWYHPTATLSMLTLIEYSHLQEKHKVLE